MDFRLPNWAARHALFAPWGILAATYALTMYVKAVGWDIWSDRGNVVFLSDMVDLGIVVYACGASIVEVFIGMAFYALEQRKKRQEQRRKQEEEMREKAAREGRLKGMQEGRQEGIQEGRQEGREEALRMFSHSMIVKANENPDASVEELVEAVTLEMEQVGRN